MDGTEYQFFSQRTMNGGVKMLTADQIQQINAAAGLAGEAGEVLDLVKKIVFHGHEADPEKIKEELGDVIWYVAALCTLFRLRLGDVMRANVEKLWTRYPDGFKASDSINRGDG